jgi:hypothetical protein
MDYGLVGDLVKTAARVESLTKYYGVRLLVTRHTFAKLSAPPHTFSGSGHGWMVRNGCLIFWRSSASNSIKFAQGSFAEEGLPQPAEVTLGRGFIRMIRPARYAETAMLVRLQPYDPNKIPVLMTHGLQDTPATWAPLHQNQEGMEEADRILRLNLRTDDVVSSLLH